MIHLFYWSFETVGRIFLLEQKPSLPAFDSFSVWFENYNDCQSGHTTPFPQPRADCAPVTQSLLCVTFQTIARVGDD